MIEFNNTGTVEALSGTLVFRGGGVSSGTITGVAGTTLEYGAAYMFDGDISTGGSVVFSSNSIFVNAGYDVAGETFFSSGSVTFANKPVQLNVSQISSNLIFEFEDEIVFGTLAHTAGRWTTEGPVTVTEFEWSGGSMDGAGQFTIPSGGTLTVPETASTPQLTGKTLRLEGDTVLAGGQVRLRDGGTIDNLGVFDIQGDGNVTPFSGSNTINNAGTFRKSAGEGTSSVGNGIAFNNTGTVEVLSGTLRIVNAMSQTDGKISVVDSIFSPDQPLNIEGGRLEGTGTVDGDVTSSGIVSPGASAGTLTIDGTYTQTEAGTLEIELSGLIAGDEHDVLSVTGAGELSGGLQVLLLDDYIPVQYDTFEIATFASRTGEFATAEFARSDELGWTIQYGDGIVSLVISNTAPKFAGGTTQQSGPEGTELSLDMSATDDDLPAQLLTYSLLDAPAGASIDSSTGLFAWMTQESQGPGTNTVTIVVSDDGVPVLSRTNVVEVVLEEINEAPALTLPGDLSVNELSLLNLQATATDSDIPVNALTFSLVGGPEGLTVDASTGAIAWTPGETQGPDAHVVTIRVTDNNPDATNDQTLSAEGSFTITVNEVNAAPNLQSPGDQTVDELSQLAFSVSATDGDVPQNGLMFELIDGPEGMTVDANGSLLWTPTETQAPDVHSVIIRVTDDGSPLASDEVSFNVTVNEVNIAPVLEDIAILFAHSAATYAVSAIATDADEPSNTLVYSIVSGPEGAEIDGSTGRFTWKVPAESEGSTVDVTIGVADGGSPELSDEVTFTIDVGGVLQISSFELTDGIFEVDWDAIAGLTYALEFNDALGVSQWAMVGEAVVADTNSATQSDPGSSTSNARLYRIRQIQP